MRRDRTEELKEILRGWYLGEGEVQSDNLEDLISWTLSASSPAGLSPAQRRLTSAVVERTQRALGCNRLPAGRNPNLECMAHTLGPLAPCWKPLLFYLVVHVARSLSGALLGACGFELRRQGPLEYWFHPATARRIALLAQGSGRLQAPSRAAPTGCSTQNKPNTTGRTHAQTSRP